MATLRESLTYTPTELGFGTSGLRGLVTDMTDLECYINTLGFLEYLQSQGLLRDNVYVAGDLRDSTNRIMSAVLKAVTDYGQEPIFFGYIPTPALALEALQNDVPCIMVTGSHIPADRNGIKFYRPDGEVLKQDETGIKEAVAKVRENIYKESDDTSQFDAQGMFTAGQLLPNSQPKAADNYRANFLSVFADKPLAGKQVVVYQHSAVGRDMLASLLQEMGADVVTVGRSDVFVPIDTENVTPDDQAYFNSLATEYPGVFAIVSTDGDSDRPFVIDERGVFHRGDELGAVVADALGADFIAIPISSNDNINDFAAQKGIELVHTKIGSPHVIAAMQSAEDRKKTIVGWEVNGGFMLGTDVPFAQGILKRLPTRDAFLPIFVSLFLAAKNQSALSAIFDALPPRFTQAGMIDNFPVEVSRQIIEQMAGEQALELIGQYFTSKQGYAKATDINTLDGVRITFANNEIAHLRPSGNAPQMRIYSVSDSQARSDEIVAQVIAEPKGILRGIEASLGA